MAYEMDRRADVAVESVGPCFSFLCRGGCTRVGGMQSNRKTDKQDRSRRCGGGGIYNFSPCDSAALANAGRGLKFFLSGEAEEVIVPHAGSAG